MSIVLFLFTLFVYVNYFIPMTDWLGYWDEILTLGLVFIGIAQQLNNGHFIIKNNKPETRIVLYTIAICAIGLTGNFLFTNQPSISAIFRDLVGFIKFPISFVVCKGLRKEKNWERVVKKNVIPVLKVLIWVIAILGIVSIFINIGLSHMTDFRGGIRPYKFLADHPTSLVIALVLIWCTFICFEDQERKNKNLIYYILISISLILTMRTKAFVIVAVIWYIKYLTRITRRFKILYWVTIAAVVFAASYSKLQLYSTFGGSGRFDLYTGSLTLSKMYFPIGSGFGTYASHLSGTYISRVYSFIKVSEIFDLFGMPTDVIGDTGFPYYIGQFGVLGSFLMIMVFIELFNMCSFSRLNNYACFFILLYIIIGLTTESTLLNYGVQLAIVLAICLKSTENKTMPKSQVLR